LWSAIEFYKNLRISAIRRMTSLKIPHQTGVNWVGDRQKAVGIGLRLGDFDGWVYAFGWATDWQAYSYG
jgi:hypothetical protein